MQSCRKQPVSMERFPSVTVFHKVMWNWNYIFDVFELMQIFYQQLSWPTSDSPLSIVLWWAAGSRQGVQLLARTRIKNRGGSTGLRQLDGSRIICCHNFFPLPFYSGASHKAASGSERVSSTWGQRQRVDSSSESGEGVWERISEGGMAEEVGALQPSSLQQQRSVSKEERQQLSRAGGMGGSVQPFTSEKEAYRGGVEGGFSGLDGQQQSSREGWQEWDRSSVGSAATSQTMCKHQRTGGVG